MTTIIRLITLAALFVSLFSESSSYSFQIKMYWEQGTEWQESFKERKWCIECDHNCDEGEQLKIEACDSGTSEQFWDYSDGKLAPERNPDVCMTYGSQGSNDIHLRYCDDINYADNQRIAEFDYNGSKFQLRPEADRGKDSADAKCVSNQHHPKAGETLHLVRCLDAEQNDPGINDDTSHWVVGVFDC